MVRGNGPQVGVREAATIFSALVLALVLVFSPVALSAGQEFSRSDTDALPPGLYPALVAAIQIDASSEYALVPLDGARHGADNTAQGLGLNFGAEGVELGPGDNSTGAWRFGLQLVEFGSDSESHPVPAAQVVVAGNRIEYRRGPGLVEWYVNGPLGLEQGFTLAAPPACAKPKRRCGEGRPAGRGMTGDGVVLRLAMSGDLRPEAAAAGEIGLRGPERTTVLRYGGLYAFDSAGRVLPSQLVLAGDELVIRVDDRDAAYPLVIDPLIFTETKLIASDPAAEDEFGISVAVSGQIAVVGAHEDDDSGLNSGSAYIFVKNGATWSQQAKLIASDAALLDRFGTSVAISGETVVVGATLGDSMTVADSGAAYVFVSDGDGWSQQAKLFASDAELADFFGFSVAISGETAVVGAYFNDDAGSNSGSAYVFVRSGTTWSEQTKLTAIDASAGDNFGGSVAISGETAVVGALGDSDAGTASGSAYIFVRSGLSWSEQARPTASDAAQFDQFGTSVAISGETAIMGAPGNDDAGSGSGSAYVFVRDGTIWSEQDKLTASDAAGGDLFGISVVISGETAIVGAYHDGNASLNSGSAYVFVRDVATWSEEAILTAADPAAGDEFGVSVAISGVTAVVGAYRDDDPGVGSGSAYVFEFPNLDPTPNPGGFLPAVFELLLQE